MMTQRLNRHFPPFTNIQQLPRLLVRLLAGLLLIWGSMVFAQNWQHTLPVPPAELTLYAYLPDNGGWVGEPLRVESGRDVHLTVQTVEGAHALRIAHTDIESSLLTPGSVQALTFAAPAPGRYVLSCTVWCGPNHWRMRTVLDVVDPIDPDALISYVEDSPRYEIPWAQLDIDAPHPASVWPETPADTATGSALWQSLGDETNPATVLTELDWPLLSPSDVYLSLQDGQAFPATLSASEAELWALLAFLWEAKSTPDVLARGADIYAENCASCHGVDGSGNGFAAAESPATEPDFRYAPAAAGASPMQYYAKIARGGMGTGMPNWGRVLGEDDLWAVTEYLYTFLFRDPHANEKDIPANEGQVHSDSTVYDH